MNSMVIYDIFVSVNIKSRYAVFRCNYAVNYISYFCFTINSVAIPNHDLLNHD